MTDTDALTERIAESLCEPAHLSRWPLAMITTYCGQCWERATTVASTVAEEVRKAKAEALRAWASGVESQLDATASEGIALGEWGRGLRSGVQQARDTADRIETGDSDEHR